MRDFFACAIVFVIIVAFCWDAHHPDYNQQAIQDIVGEAANQDQLTMECVAHAIRNRGNLKGVYGLNAKHIWTEPAKVWGMAQSAWEQAAYDEDPVWGAKNFGTAADLEKEGIDNDDNHLTRCGDFYFY